MLVVTLLKAKSTEMTRFALFAMELLYLKAKSRVFVGLKTT